MKGICKDCKWWDYIDSENVDNTGGFGECKRNAPLPYHIPDSNVGISVKWPVTDDDDWCGEFEDKKQVLLYDTSIDVLRLGVRASNCLESANIRTLGQLKSIDDQKLRYIRSLGRVTLWEIRQKLADFGAKNEN